MPEAAALARSIAIACALLAGGCAQRLKPVPAPSATVTIDPIPADSWLSVATAADQDRLRGLDAIWASTLTDARARFARPVAQEGPLLDPAGALTRVAPPPGTYDCRIVTIGRGDARGRALQSFKPQICFVVAEEKLLVLMKATGSNLFGGRLWDDGDKRMIFLGAAVAREGQAAPAYGLDARRDRAGVLERVGDFRWRLVTPSSGRTPVLEIMELTPRPTSPSAATSAVTIRRVPPRAS
jgi:Domain of unknown function (DUF4893)